MLLNCSISMGKKKNVIIFHASTIGSRDWLFTRPSVTINELQMMLRLSGHDGRLSRSRKISSIHLIPTKL